MSGDHCNLLNGEARLKQAARALVTKVVEMQVLDFQFPTGTSEGSPGRSAVVGEDATLAARVVPLLFDGSRARRSRSRTVAEYAYDCPSCAAGPFDLAGEGCCYTR